MLKRSQSTASLPLIALTLNLLVPGAGLLLAGQVRAAVAVPATIAGLISLFGWSRWILTPTGWWSLLLLIILIVVSSTVWLWSLGYRQGWHWHGRQAAFTLIFLVGSSGFLFCGFATKQHWLGIHILFVPSQSMQPTLQPGDFILVDTWLYRQSAPETGDVVVFNLPRQNAFAVKRLMRKPDHQTLLLGSDNPLHNRDGRRLISSTPNQLLGRATLVILSMNHQGTLRTERWLIPIH